MSKNTQTQAPTQKNVGYRLLAVLFLLVCVAAVILPVGTFTSAWVVEQKSLIDTVKALLDSQVKLFGAVPVFFEAEAAPTVSKIANLVIYLRAVTIVVAALVSIFAIFSKKSAPRRICTAVVFYTFGAVLYALAIVGVSNSQGLETVYELYSVVFAAAGVIVYFVLMLAKLGKGAFVSFLQLVLALATSGLLVFALTSDSAAMTTLFATNALYKTAYMAILAVAALNILVALIRATCVKGLALDMVRYVVMLLVALVACYVCYMAALADKKTLLLVIGSAVVCVLQIIIATLQLGGFAKKNTQLVVEETLAGFEKEEYVETYAYDGGPVAGVELAEEVTPTMAAANGTQPDLASLIGNGFDPFMSILTPQEKAEFIDLYILRCKSPMPEIPGYVVGDTNKDFFNKVFIYLGQYRDKIPSTLLQKMFDYSMKL